MTRNGFALKGLLGFPPSGYQISGLLSHFLKALTNHRAVEAIDGDACLADLSAGALAKAEAPRLRDEGGPASP